MTNSRRDNRAGFCQLTGLAGLMVMAVLLSPVYAAEQAIINPADLGLIAVTTLQQQSERWVLLDARPKSRWMAGHLAGAHSFSWQDYTRTDAQQVPYRPWQPEELAAVLGQFGISATTPVVVYGDADTSWGGEGWTVWLLAWLGHQGPIRLLNGGIQAWQQAHLPLSQEVAPVKEFVPYQVELRAALLTSTDEIARDPQSETLVDVRSLFEWLKGRVPGAVRIPWEDFYHDKNRAPLTAEALRKLFARNAIDPAKPVIFYCDGGIRSAYAWLVYQLAELPDGRNYEGGMEAWKRRPQP